jgi:hypothetical protein
MTAFNIGKMKNVKPGDWIFASQTFGTTLFAKVCDNKFNGECMVYYYNNAFPDGHEAGMLYASDANDFKKVPQWAQKQFDDQEHGIAATEFFKMAKAGNYE